MKERLKEKSDSKKNEVNFTQLVFFTWGFMIFCRNLRGGGIDDLDREIDVTGWC